MKCFTSCDTANYVTSVSKKTVTKHSYILLLRFVTVFLNFFHVETWFFPQCLKWSNVKYLSILKSKTISSFFHMFLATSVCVIFYDQLVYSTHICFQKCQMTILCHSIMLPVFVSYCWVTDTTTWHLDKDGDLGIWMWNWGFMEVVST